MSETGIPIEWMFIQPAGTNHQGSGNCWDNRLALLDVSRERQNAHTCITGYWTPLEDGVHYSAKGRVLLGEHVGRKIVALETGQRAEIARLKKIRLDETRVTLTFDTDAPIIIADDIDLAHEPACGFWSVDKNRSTIISVKEVSDTMIALNLAQPPDPKTLTIGYAHRNWGRKDALLNGSEILPIGRGALRTIFSEPSAYFPDETQYDWVASFMVKASK